MKKYAGILSIVVSGFILLSCAGNYTTPGSTSSGDVADSVGSTRSADASSSSISASGSVSQEEEYQHTQTITASSPVQEEIISIDVFWNGTENGQLTPIVCWFGTPGERPESDAGYTMEDMSTDS